MGADVVVVIGTGGMGQAVARRQGSGRKLLLADVDEAVLEATAERFRGEGHDVAAHPVDVSRHPSVTDLARAAAGLGAVLQVVHTAGLSPAQASAPDILAVDLAGVAYVLEEFGRVVAPGGAGVVIASMAGHMVPATALPPELEEALAAGPADELLALPFLSDPSLSDPGAAYAFAKRANQLRVCAASVSWGARGARVNSLSPGVISTSMGHEELASASGAFMRAMVEASGTGRLGTPDDIAAAVAFLLGEGSSFVTGTDLLVDGGAVAALRSGRVQMPG
ncbi:MAG: SDR family oxidoreductase [Acidimicrobiales bacterium]|nr:SDR family oxidoreductase [Acidimicrobiales bacterium]